MGRKCLLSVITHKGRLEMDKKLAVALLVATIGLTCLAPSLRASVPQELETERSHDNWYAEFPPAQAEARKLGKDMLIDFTGTDWCAPCKWLLTRVFSKPEFNTKAKEQFVLVDIDDKARGL